MRNRIFAILILFTAVAFAQGSALSNRLSPRNRGSGSGMRRNGASGAQQAEAASAAAEEAVKNAPKGTNGVPALVFDKAPLELVLKAYADIVQRTIIPAPDLPKAEITLKSLEGQTLEKEEYLEAIEVVLTMNGVVLEPRGEKFLRALARKSVRTQGIPILLRNKGNLPEQGRVVSQMITFQNITAEEAENALKGFLDSNNGQFQRFERTNAILVTDTQENINRMLEIVREIDIASPVMEDVFTVQIKYALAADIKKALETIVTESQKEQPKETVATKTSGAPGFARSQPSPGGSRLLNLNNRPGVQPPPEPKPNETVVAAISDADRGMIRGKVLILDDERSNKLIIITSKANMKFFDKVIETLDVETTPDVQIELVRLNYADCEDVVGMLNDLIGNASSASSQSKNNQNTSAANAAGGSKNLTTGAASAQRARAKPAAGSINSSKVGELSKDNCKVLADKRINGVVVYARTQDMDTLKNIIRKMDIKLSQVLIETVIIEVSLGDDINTGIDWVQRGRVRTTMNEPIKDAAGNQMYWTKRTTTDSNGNTSTTYVRQAVPSGYSSKWTKDGTTYEEVSAGEGFEAYQTVTKLIKDGFFNNGGYNNGNRDGYMLGGGGGSSASSSMLGSLVGVAGAAAGAAATNAVNASPIGSGISYILKSDKLNIAAIIQASKTDTRAKYIASPIVMTVDNKEAVIEATESRKFYSGSTTSSGGYNNTTSYNYSDKDIGIKIKVTPKINPDRTVMLEVEEEYSQLGGGQTVFVSSDSGGAKQEPIDTAVNRKMSGDILLDNMQTVVLGGLTETYKSEKETGIPILKDIPWIGKWLFGSVSQSETRKELLVFMTPYVFDSKDKNAAQAEALRRKEALSDPRPWEDHGWSTSSLADPVSKKERLRRFNDEWARQDEERKTKLAIEKAKIDRAKALEKMDEKERKFWLELHKDELEKEAKEEFEKKMEEEKDLRDLAASIRAKKLEEAEAKLKAEDEATKGETERERLRKEKEAKSEEGKVKSESSSAEAATTEASASARASSSAKAPSSAKATEGKTEGKPGASNL